MKTKRRRQDFSNNRLPPLPHLSKSSIGFSVVGAINYGNSLKVENFNLKNRKLVENNGHKQRFLNMLNLMYKLLLIEN